MWLKDKLRNFSVLQRVHLSNLVFFDECVTGLISLLIRCIIFADLSYRAVGYASSSKVRTLVAEMNYYEHSHVGLCVYICYR
jgi:hypothetical protein